MFKFFQPIHKFIKKLVCVMCSMLRHLRHDMADFARLIPNAYFRRNIVKFSNHDSIKIYYRVGQIYIYSESDIGCVRM